MKTPSASGTRPRSAVALGAALAGLAPLALLAWVLYRAGRGACASCVPGLPTAELVATGTVAFLGTGLAAIVALREAARALRSDGRAIAAFALGALEIVALVAAILFLAG